MCVHGFPRENSCMNTFFVIVLCYVVFFSCCVVLCFDVWVAFLSCYVVLCCVVFLLCCVVLCCVVLCCVSRVALCCFGCFVLYPWHRPEDIRRYPWYMTRDIAVPSSGFLPSMVPGPANLVSPK